MSEVDRLMQQLPVDLSTQYGLHLYRAELDRANEDLLAARAHSSQRWDELQALLDNAKSSPGALTHHQALTEKINKRRQELEEQIRNLEQTISAIHEYRRHNGLSELRDVVAISTSVRLK